MTVISSKIGIVNSKPTCNLFKTSETVFSSLEIVVLQNRSDVTVTFELRF